ncbi:MAG: metal-dependent transcriptional regulator [Clostridia bacterium]|nr:metal-dependent transcriptional regulator [Clostridia bacterium]MEE0808474.1 metal-dependent transcriptional regulator [Acutalibacteraceae bacterium]
MQESGEMYLETIYTLLSRNERVRSIDICKEMGYSKPSVSRAVGLLKKAGHITVDVDGYITLNDSGLKIARVIFERHTVLTEMLISLGVDSTVAARDACKIEHSISDETFEAIKEHYSKTKNI